LKGKKGKKREKREKGIPNGGHGALSEGVIHKASDDAGLPSLSGLRKEKKFTVFNFERRMASSKKKKKKKENFPKKGRKKTRKKGGGGRTPRRQILRSFFWSPGAAGSIFSFQNTSQRSK